MGEKEVVSRRGLAKKHGALDYEVWQWKTRLENERGTKHVTKNEIQAHALEIYKAAGIDKFKASDGWYRRWRQRWQSSNVTVINTKEQTGTAKVKSEAKKIPLEPPRKRRVCEAELIDEKYAIKNSRSSDSKTTNNLFQDNPKLQGYQDTSTINHFKESQLSSKDEIPEVSGKTEKNISVALGPPVSIENPLIFNVNFVKLKDSKRAKIFDLKSKDGNKTLKTSSVYGLITSHEISDSKPEANTLDSVESTKGDCSGCGKTPLIGVQNVKVVRPIKTGAVFFENESSMQNTIELVESTGEENLWAIVDQEQGDIHLVGGITACSQGDNGISIPSTSRSVETASSFTLSPVYEQNEIDFSENEHELFCESCEDFHPSQSSCKQKKETRNSFLLSCVFENKESIVPANLSHLNVVYDKNPTINNCDNLDSQLQNQKAIASKGKRYLIQFKSKVVNFAFNHSIKLAAEKFQVNRNTVAEWLAEHNRFSAKAPVKYLDKDIAGDSEFLSWLEDSKFNLTNELIKQKVTEWLQVNKNNSSCQSQWLRMYANRLTGTADVTVQKRYIFYPEAFKRAVVFHAQTHSNMAAARVFGVARKRIIEWQQHSSDLKKSLKTANAGNVTDYAVDEQIYEWYCRQQPPPSSRQVRNKALELYRAAGHTSIQCKSQWYYRWRARHNLPPSREQLLSNTTPLLVWALSQLDNNESISQSSLAAQAVLLGHEKVSRSWCFRFCRRHAALLQALPSPDTPLPSALERQVAEYRRRLLDVISSRGVTPERIVALDEVPLHFLSKDKTRKPLLVRRPGFESCQATLMISCQADGSLLPTVFVFKGLGPDASSTSDSHVIACTTDTGRVSDDTVQQWLSAVCFPSLSEGGVVVLDSFEMHVTHEVSQSVMSRDIHLAVTPPGCAFKLLPITPFCFKFKAVVEDMCQKWLSAQTAALESPSPNLLYQWAVRAHRHMAKHYKEKIKCAFKNILLQYCEDNCI